MILCRNREIFVVVVLLLFDSSRFIDGFKLGEKIKSGLGLKEKKLTIKNNDSVDEVRGEKDEPNEIRGDSKDERKLRQKLAEIFDKNDLDQKDQNFLYNMISESNSYMIIDCQKPSYINSNHETIVLKNHILNDHLIRKQHPDYNETDAYICDRAENVWRINPEVFGGNSGFIGFDESRPGEADSNFVTFADESTIREYLKNQDAKLVKKVVEQTFKLIHHPKYFKSSKNVKKPREMDVFAEQEKRLPVWFKERRKREMDALYERITADSNSLGIEGNGQNIKDYLFGGDGYSLVVFDCESPSYLFPSADRNAQMDVVKIESPELRLVLKKFGKCEKSENIWRRYRDNNGNKPTNRVSDISQLNYLTYDIKSNSLGYSPNLDLLKILNVKGFCRDFMSFLYHPGYYSLSSSKLRFKQPIECSTPMKSDLEDERKVTKIVTGPKAKKTKFKVNFNLNEEKSSNVKTDRFDDMDFNDFNTSF